MSKALTTVDRLRNRVNASSDGDINSVLFQSLASATTQLIALLRNQSFDATSGVSEDFEIPGEHPYNHQRYINLRLNNGFVDQVTNPVTIQYGADASDLTAIDASVFNVQEEKGLVVFDTSLFQEFLLPNYRVPLGTDHRYAGLIFRVTYDHGFQESSTTLGKVYKGVPAWLEEAALIKAREIYKLTIPKKKNDAKESSMNLGPIIEPYIRYYPSAVNPVM